MTITDPRFKNLHTDPRFLRPSKRVQQKVIEEDERFQTVTKSKKKSTGKCLLRIILFIRDTLMLTFLMILLMIWVFTSSFEAKVKWRHPTESIFSGFSTWSSLTREFR